MPWTKAQQDAIETENVNLLVSAAAGSGKTAVLTERIVRLVCAGTDIDQFLVVTFTEAATEEMKRRISARLHQAAREEIDPELASRLRREALSVGRANISTLHKFCLYILRRNFHRLGLDPGFRPADEVQSSMLLRQALEETAAKRYETEDAAFLALLHGAGGEENVFSHTLKLHRFLMAQPDPWAWLTRAEAQYSLTGEEFLEHPALYALCGDLQAEARNQYDNLRRARELTPAEYAATRSLLDMELAQTGALLLDKIQSLPQYRAQLLSVSFGRFTWPRGDVEPDLKKRVTTLRDRARKEIQRQQALLARPLEEEAEFYSLISPQVGALCAFVRDVDARYAEQKRGHGVVDFSDMEHLALRALREEETRTALKNRFRYIFVDEYQDSSRIQECLIESVRREDNVFLVGDVKQSIYRFRQADPGLFLNKLGTYTGEEGAPGRQIHLNTNFRSERPVIEAVNAVFSRIMTKEAAELTYDDTAALKCPENMPQNSMLAGVECHIIERGDAAAGPEAAEDALEQEAAADDDAAQEEQGAASEEEEAYIAGDVEAEAMLAARRIRELMEDIRCPDKNGGTRALKYSDFAILLRSQRRAAEAWAQTLAKMGIPAYVHLTGGYFDAIEVQVFLNLLRVIDNRRQDIPMLSVLRSPVFHFTVEELITLRTDCNAEAWIDRLILCSRQDTPLGSKALQVILLLTKYKRESLLVPLPELIAWLMDETGYYDCVGALPNGKERQANLDALIERARAYADAGFPLDLWSFLQYMDKAAATAQLGCAQAGAADVVRVLSMHASKGLEFPVVFCAGLGQGFNRLAGQDDIAAEPSLGLGLRVRVGHVRRDTLFRQAITSRLLREQLAEEMRILYVGMTRAKNRLILIGSMKNAWETAQELQTAELTPAYCIKAKSALSWILPVAMQTSALPVDFCTRGNPASIHVSLPETPQEREEQAQMFAVLRERFDWRYPHMAATGIPTKRSVSGLMHAHSVSLREAPAFARERAGITGAQRGTYAHAVLREIALSRVPAGNAVSFVREEMDRMVAKGLLSAEQAQAVDARDIAAFLKSPLGLRLRSSPKVERELEFAANVDVERLPLEGTGEQVLLQGVIDCCFREDGGWVLLDYKTDALLPHETPFDAANKHIGQLTLYASALETLSGLPVMERYVVLLGAGEAVAV
ncbi:MAG TPA: UvrD-helicase domain-containing protein [Feifaniaceae bacterium]|nr:UvrD-helicase domain-containing protein [Feifaniaceae bacterium]